MKKIILLLGFLITSLSGYTQMLKLITPNNSKPIEFDNGTVSEYAKIVNLLDWRGVVVSIPENISKKAVSLDVIIVDPDAPH